MTSITGAATHEHAVPFLSVYPSLHYYMLSPQFSRLCRSTEKALRLSSLPLLAIIHVYTLVNKNIKHFYNVYHNHLLLTTFPAHHHHHLTSLRPPRSHHCRSGPRSNYRRDTPDPSTTLSFIMGQSWITDIPRVIRDKFSSCSHWTLITYSIVGWWQRKQSPHRLISCVHCSRGK